MQPALGLGAVVLTGLAAVGVAFLVVPDDGPTGPRPGAGQDSGAAQAVQAAREFWDLAIQGDCSAASRLMWWPADRQARRAGYARVCEDAEAPADVDIGEPRAGGSTEMPYGATDYLVVPVTLRSPGREPVADELRMVEVQDAWYVIR